MSWPVKKINSFSWKTIINYLFPEATATAYSETDGISLHFIF